MPELSTIRGRYQDVTGPRVLLDCALDTALGSILPQPPANTSVSPPAVAGLGHLGKLPVELILDILPQLDLRSLTNFQYVNRCAAGIISTLPHFSLLARHARNVLRGTLAIETGGFISCEQLVGQLFEFRCLYCGGFGGYLYLITFKRVCYGCFVQDSRLRPITVNTARLRFGLDDEALESVPSMKYVAGVYGRDHFRFEHRGKVVQEDEASRAGIALHGSKDALASYVDRMPEEMASKYRVKFPPGWRNSGPAGRGQIPPEIYDAGPPNPYRFVAICEVPWIDDKSSQLDWGFRCAACHSGTVRDETMSSWWELFNMQTFEVHLQHYGQIRDGQHERNTEEELGLSPASAELQS